MGIKKFFTSFFSGRVDIDKDPEGFIAIVLRDMNEKIPAMRELLSGINEKMRILDRQDDRLTGGPAADFPQSVLSGEQETIRRQLLDLEIVYNRAIEAMNRYVGERRNDIKQALLRMENSRSKEFMNRFNETMTRFEFSVNGNKKEKKREERYERAEVLARTLESYGHLISKRNIAEMVSDAAETAISIIGMFKRRSQTGYHDSMFINYYLNAAVETVKEYLELQNKESGNSSLKELIAKTEATISLVHSSFRKIHSGISQTHYMDFNLEIDLLRKTLEEID